LKGYLVAKLPRLPWHTWQNPFKIEGSWQRFDGFSINCQIAKMASLYGKFTSPVYIPHYLKRTSRKNPYHSNHIASQEVNGIRWPIHETHQNSAKLIWISKSFDRRTSMFTR
jgi:hypothetical protein